MPDSHQPQEDRFHPQDRDEWRDWLESNHETSKGVWLVSWKKATGKPRLTYDEAVEEALCFGWIDSRPNKLDDERSMLWFTPRNPGSVWSRINKQRIEKLVDTGRIAPAGTALVEAAKRDSSWTSLDRVEDLIVPSDLEEALQASPDAQQYFTSFAPSVKKPLLWWIESAKRPETRARRIRRVVESAERNENPLAYRKK